MAELRAFDAGFGRPWPGMAFARLTDAILIHRGQLLPLGVVGFGLGIWIWFSLKYDPDAVMIFAAGFGFMVCAITIWRGGDIFFPWAALGLACCAGFLAAEARAHMMDAPVLTFRYYGPIEGRVTDIDRSSSDALRLTLDRVVLERMGPDRMPVKLRISILSDKLYHIPQPGDLVMTTGHLSPPQSASEPDGFDFRRMAWFDQLGAIGYTRNPVLLLEDASGADQLIGRIRMMLSEAIRRHIPGEAGHFAAGAMTGDRSGISQATYVALRDSSLAHILAISGMNMAFLAGFIFGLVRGAIALIPWLALRVNARNIAAVITLGAGGFYLSLSGANVATERAYYMLIVMMSAVLLDRRAISLRTAALAGGILLALKPESLMEPGFQMSFAATIALISGFHALQSASLSGRMNRVVLAGFTLVLSSVIGGFATAPWAAFHFNRFADYGLLANLLTVPAMGIAIMPMGVIAILLAPFGLEALPLWVMGLGCEWILWMAYEIAALEGAVRGIPAPAKGALAWVTFGGLWLICWPGRARYVGAAGLTIGLILWPMGQRPHLLISTDGRLVGLMQPEGRALSSATGGGFAASSWLENDGDLTGQSKAALRPGFEGPKHARYFQISGLRMVLLSGKKGQEGLERACQEADLVILAARAEDQIANCPLLDQNILSRTGALAFWHEGEKLLLTPGNAARRKWNGAGYDRGDLLARLPQGIDLKD